LNTSIHIPTDLSDPSRLRRIAQGELGPVAGGVSDTLTASADRIEALTRRAVEAERRLAGGSVASGVTSIELPFDESDEESVREAVEDAFIGLVNEL
jgi:hypothetical protein